MVAKGAELEGLIATLEGVHEMRVLRPLKARRSTAGMEDDHLPIVTLVDCETTGLDHAKDAVVELATLSFRYDPETGDVHDPFMETSDFQDPGRPIPQQVSAIHGITDDMVAGRAINRTRVAEQIARSTLVVSHKADFDRPFIDRLGVGSEDAAWACSLKEVAWRDRGFDGSSLHPLGLQCGLHTTSHRSLWDCRLLHALLAIGAGRDPAGWTKPSWMKGSLDNAMRDIWASSLEQTIHLFAENSDFAFKDELKQRDYRWNPGADGRPKAWYKTLPDDACADAEEAWLRERIVPPIARPLFRQSVTARTRFR